MTAPGQEAARDRLHRAGPTARQAWSQTRQAAGAMLLLVTAFALCWGAGWVVTEIPLHDGYSDHLRVGWAAVTVGLYLFVLVLVGPSVWRHEPLGRPDASDSRLARFTVGMRAVATVWIAGFAAFVLVTVLLVQYDKVRLATAATPMHPAETLGFLETSGLYLWHLLDVIPFAHIPETLGWGQPGPNRSDVVGALLVAYKLTVLGVVLAAFRGVIKMSREAVAAPPQSAAERLDADLRTLVALHADELLNDAEFENRRAALLDQQQSPRPKDPS